MARSLRTHQDWLNEDAVHFVSTPTFKRLPLFVDQRLCQIVWDDLFFYAKKYDVLLLSFVIMPDHLHLQFWPKGEKSFSDFMRGVKGHSARCVLDVLKSDQDLQAILAQLVVAGAEAPAYIRGRKQHLNDSHDVDAHYQVWQAEFFDYLCLSEAKVFEKLDYIKSNPQEDGLVQDGKKFRWLYVNPDIDKIDF